MILAHAKPKYRAKAYERFMLIAQHLYRLHDYASLHAVVTGLEDLAITRLHSTHALLKPWVGKERQFFKDLMSGRRAWHAYRTAVAKDVEEGHFAVPFL